MDVFSTKFWFKMKLRKVELKKSSIIPTVASFASRSYFTSAKLMLRELAELSSLELNGWMDDTTIQDTRYKRPNGSDLSAKLAYKLFNAFRKFFETS
ncbi:CLUMA_CG002167, isoform A [Clunio marinus]|uniref:CLUMA_CG002167, isoform A n=1 Tax=Clunio marinus TaxID=568069 RepID=A0A1J1HPI7_9DIPT|nr:CLUMA_CG002167, isoform A [Clunio marinus]